MFDDRSNKSARATHEDSRPLVRAGRLIERLERVRRKCSDDDARAALRRVIQAARDSFRRCCNDYVTIRANCSSGEIADIAPREILNTIRSACESFAAKRGLNCDFAVNPRIPDILRGNADVFSRTLQVLCSHALARTAMGGICVRVVVDREHEGSIELRATVSDTGAGSGEDLELIRPMGPSPLAIDLCRADIESCGGTFGIEHEPGRGSTSWFTMRFESASSATRECKPVHDTHALVVGRDAVETRIISEYFECWDIRHTPCTDLDELGITLRLSSDHADLLVVGANDNLELIEVHEGVHAVKNDASPSLVGISDDADPATLAAARRAGIAAIIQRPLDQSAMFDAVLAALSHCRSVRAEREHHQPGQPAISHATVDIDDGATAHAVMFIIESLGMPAMITPRVGRATSSKNDTVTIQDRLCTMATNARTTTLTIARSLMPTLLAEMPYSGNGSCARAA